MIHIRIFKNHSFLDLLLLLADVWLDNLLFHLGYHTRLWLNHNSSSGLGLFKSWPNCNRWLDFLVLSLIFLELCFNCALFSGHSWLSLQFQTYFPVFFLQQLCPLFVIHPIVFCDFFLLHLIFLLLFVDKILQQILRVDDGLPSIQVLYILKRLHELHFSLRVIRSVLEVLHGVFLLFVYLQPLEVLLGLLRVLNSLIVPGSSRFHDIIMVLGISFEGDLGIAIGAFEVEPEDFDAQIGLLVTDLHTHVELSTDVKIVGTCIAAQGHRQHVSHHHQLVLATPTLLDALVVEVFGEIFDKDLTLSHLSIKYYTLLKIELSIEVKTSRIKETSIFIWQKCDKKYITSGFQFIILLSTFYAQNAQQVSTNLSLSFKYQQLIQIFIGSLCLIIRFKEQLRTGTLRGGYSIDCSYFSRENRQKIRDRIRAEKRDAEFDAKERYMESKQFQKGYSCRNCHRELNERTMRCNCSNNDYY